MILENRETVRLDVRLLQLGLLHSRAKAQSAIKDGLVQLNGQVCTRPAQPCGAVDQVALTSSLTSSFQWVARSAQKLLHGLEHFDCNPEGMICLDIGASTGGFTQVLLHKGARKVYAVDVGQGQLAAQIKQDARVISLEKTDARHLNTALIPEPIALLTADVSFISVTKALGAGLQCAEKAMILIKPQFELTPKDISKGGVVKDPALHQQAIARVLDWITGEDWKVKGVTPSPLTGSGGNQEFLLYAVKQ